MTNETKLSALAAYAARVGAEQRNFRRWIIREQARDLYHHDKHTISVKADGTLNCYSSGRGTFPDELLPTPDEAAAIKAECAAADWPRSIATTPQWVETLRQQLKAQHGIEPELFIFEELNGDKVAYVQQRIRTGDGGKRDLPWSFWSDGEWRMMEPDGLLPLHGLPQLKTAAAAMLHEGAKTSAFNTWVFETDARTDGEKRQKALDRYPWAREIGHVAHIGWAGGAPNPHRVDWGPIRALPPHVRICLVCDNDPAGENAAPYISHAIKRRLTVVRFGKQFPYGFDLSDPFPDALYESVGGHAVYRGPSFRDCSEPATWATTDKKTLRDEFIEEWSFTISPAWFIHRSNSQRRYSEAEFNIKQAPFSDVPNVAALLRKFPSARAESAVYEPGRPSGRIASPNGAQVINLYEPSPIKASQGDVTLFETYLEHLIPDTADRVELKRWIATLIARPSIRMSYGVLLISHTQGVGKTTLAEKILAPLVGLQNCSFPDPKTAVDSQFTSWLAYKRLAIIGEIYDGHTAKAYNRLKSVITDTHVHVNEKYEKEYSLTNYIHVLASSNSFRALKLDDQDRRWFVPGVTETGKDHAFWSTLNDWLKEPSALPAIAQWADDYVVEHGHVQPGVHAPASSTKRRAIEESRSEGERLIHDLGMEIAESGKRLVVRQDEIRAWLADRKSSLSQRDFGTDGKRLLETPERIASILRSCGLRLPGPQFKFEGKRFRIVANFDVPDTARWSDLSSFCCHPGQVFPM